jgi:hypothetical protein
MNIISNSKKWLDDKLGLTRSDEAIANIKKGAEDQVAEVTTTLKIQGKLQQKVIEKTTTYYIARAAGVIK